MHVEVLRKLNRVFSQFSERLEFADLICERDFCAWRCWKNYEGFKSLLRRRFVVLFVLNSLLLVVGFFKKACVTRALAPLPMNPFWQIKLYQHIYTKTFACSFEPRPHSALWRDKIWEMAAFGSQGKCGGG